MTAVTAADMTLAMIAAAMTFAVIMMMTGRVRIVGKLSV